MFAVNETHIDTTHEDREEIYDVQAMRPIAGETRGEVYRALRAEYGRCTGRMYRGAGPSDSQETGWVFRSWRCEPSGKRYRRDVWCELYEVNIATTARVGRAS